MFDSQKKHSDVNLNSLNENKEYPFKKVSANGDMVNKKLAGNKGPVEDIFAGSSDEATAEIKTEKVDAMPPLELKETPYVPTMNTNVKITSQTQTVAKQINKENKAPKSLKKNIFLTILIIFLIVIVLGLSVVFALRYFKNKSKNLVNTLDNNLQGTEHEDLQKSSEDLMDFIDSLDDSDLSKKQNQVDEIEKKKVDEDFDDFDKTTKENNILTTQDTDNDNLTDKEELELGTSINSKDSDNDGLTDYDEIKVYKTDPLNPDTDGDTYNDGSEVENGYDPLVPGGSKF